MILYHATEKENLESILKNGLMPRKNRHTKHGDSQVWLTDILENATLLATKLKNPMILRINISEKNVFVYRTYLGMKEYYTVDKIGSNRISIL